MKTRDEDIAAVTGLGHGKHCTVSWSEGGGGEVHRIWDTLFLFSIPQYGGEGRFEGVFREAEIEKLVDLSRTWT
jgi:hypothetical protein